MGVFLKTSEAGKPSHRPKARTGLKAQHLPGAMHSKAQHGPATDQQPKSGTFWEQHRLGDTASSAPLSRKLLHSMGLLPHFSICFTSLGTLHVRLPLLSSSKTLPLWEMGVSGLAGGLQRTRLRVEGHGWRALILPSREKDMEKTSRHWQPATLQMGAAKVTLLLDSICH